MAPPIVHDVLRSPGRPLEPETREFMEARFGHDFSHVRVHTDARAAQSAQAVNANAYTVGDNIVFAAGKYTPRTRASQGLVAHEITHVLQQKNLVKKPSDPIEIGETGDVFETKAEKAAHNLFEPNAFLHTETITTANIRLQRQLITPLSAGGGIGGLMERDRDREDPDPYQLLQYALRGEWHRVGDRQIEILLIANPEQRVELLLQLTHAFWTGNAKEDLIIDIIATTPDNQSADLLKLLQSKELNGTSLIKQLDRVVDLGNNLRLHEALSELRLSAMGPEKSFAAEQSALTLPWRDSMGIGEDSAVFHIWRSRRNKVVIKYPNQVMYSDDYREEVKKLPNDIFLKDGLEVEPNQLLKIHDYDQNRFVPVVAEELLGYHRSGIRGFLSQITTISALVLPVTTARTIFGKIAVYVVEKLLPILITLIQENRNNLVRWFPTLGPKLIEFADTTQYFLGLYGAIAFARFGLGLIMRWRSFRNSAILEGPGAQDPEAIQVWEKTAAAQDQVLDGIEDIRSAQAKPGQTNVDEPSVPVKGTPNKGAEKTVTSRPGTSKSAEHYTAESPAGPPGRRPGTGGANPNNQVVLYRGTLYRWVEGRSANVHDLSDGVYLTSDPELALKYADMRRAHAISEDAAKLGMEPGSISGDTGIVLRIEAEAQELGNVLDFYNNPSLKADWEQFLSQYPMGETLLRGRAGAEIYNGFFENWLITKGWRIDMFDTIIGPEYIRGGPQVCIRNPEIANKLLGRAEEWARVIDKPVVSHGSVPSSLASGSTGVPVSSEAIKPDQTNPPRLEVYKQPAPTRVRRTSSGGNPIASRKAQDMRAPGGERGPKPLSPREQEIADGLYVEHSQDAKPSRKFIEEASRGARDRGRMHVEGGEADLILSNGKLREVQVCQEHVKDWEAIQGKLIDKSRQAKSGGEIYLEVTSRMASRKEVVEKAAEFRLKGDVNLANISVRIYGPDGEIWWSGKIKPPAK